MVLFQEHVNAMHAKLVIQGSFKAISSRCERAITTDTICPLCGIRFTLQTLEKHLGLHLQEVALFALPRADKGGSEENSQTVECLGESHSDLSDSKQSEGNEQVILRPKIEGIRCICSYQHDDGFLITCSQCSELQHGACMGIDGNNVPEAYKCSACIPGAHLLEIELAINIQESFLKSYQSQLLATRTSSWPSSSHGAANPMHAAGTNHSSANEAVDPGALQTAAYNDNIDLIQLLLDRGADVNAQGGQYGNALQAAAFCGNIEIIQLLLARGADIHAQGGQYGNALQAATYRGRMGVIQLLLESGANVNMEGGMFGTVLQAAAYRGDIKVIKKLLARGANIHARAGKYGAALDKMLVQEPDHTGLKVPGDIPLLVELLQAHAPTLMEYFPESEYEGIARGFLNDDRCSLDVFRKILESRGWKRMDMRMVISPQLRLRSTEDEKGTGNEAL